MKRACFLILAMAHTAYADDPFACVAPDVAAAFLGNDFRGKSSYSTSVPEDFMELRVPSELSLIGSRTFALGARVVYKTDMPKRRAFETAVDAMLAAGWSEDERQRRGMRGGFRPSAAPANATLCKEGYDGALAIMAADKSGQTMVSYFAHPNAHACGAEARTLARHDPSELMNLLPTLALPKGVEIENTEMGGSGDEVSSTVDVSGASGRADLAGFFENQIREQGWTHQTGWTSQNSSGSVWYLDSPKNGLLIATLHLFDTGADPIRVRFSVSPADPTKGEDRGSWSSVEHVTN